MGTYEIREVEEQKYMYSHNINYTNIKVAFATFISV